MFERRRGAGLVRRGWVVLAAMALAVAGTVIPAGSAAADTNPVAPESLPTVSADSLPTVQVNGVVWAQVVVGNTVYATGSFTSARPAGSPAGTNETPRSNILAYDIRTGVLITSWAPTLNAQGLAIAASSDGTRIFVGGDFTSVSGVGKNRIVALDATTGAVVSPFSASVNSEVNAVAVSGNVLYVGGIFSTSSGNARSRLAAFSTTNGALLSWAPVSNRQIMAITAPAGTNKVIVGGRFTTLNGVAAVGMGALDSATGATLSWPVNTIVMNSGDNAGINSLTNDGTRVFGTGYTFGSGGNFENNFSADLSGNLLWVNGCRGDNYSSIPIGGVLYTVSHAHDCSQVGNFPQTLPTWTFQRAMAWTTAAGTHGESNMFGNFTGRPASENLDWSPQMDVGSYTGQEQAAWSVSGNSQYVVLGGEFPRVNFVGQQGLARFPVTSIAPNKQGPQTPDELTPTLTAVGVGALRVSWTATFDRDNRWLTYDVVRDGAVIGSVTASSTWWKRPTVAFVDTTATPGSTVTYTIRARDSFGNTIAGTTSTTGTAPASARLSGRYADAVRGDGASIYWRLGESSGGTGYDWVGGHNLTMSGVTRGTAGALVGDADTATTFPSGTSGVPAVTSVSELGPQYFSVEAWFNTTTTQGGKILGYGNSKTGNSTTYDRHIYMTNTGQLVFGVYQGGTRVVTSPNTYNDGKWHQVAAAFGNGAMQLFVDGALVASRTDTTNAQYFNGYWRVGGDTLSTGWPNAPTRSRFGGAIDDVAVYPSVLSAATVLQHYQLARSANQPPTASFTVTPSDLTAAVDASASTDPDGSIASYAWTFGDGSTGTGVTAQHAYAAAGTYTVTLTVTDNSGATGTISHPVTVTAPTQGTDFATDTFTRTLATGWGSADKGGAWTTTGSRATFAVTGTNGQVTVQAGATGTARLSSTSWQDSDVVGRFWLDSVPTGGGEYTSVVVRGASGGDYRARVRVQSTGVVQVSLTKVVAGTETALTTSATVSGVTYTPGMVLRVRTEAQGVSPTTLRIKAWVDGTTEPSAWQQTVTDSTAGLQAAGSIGVVGYLSASATAAVVAHVDDLVADRM